MFNKKEHVIKQSDIPYEDIIDWCISCDIGTANPTAFLLIGKTVDNTLYVCKEYYFDGRAAMKEEDGNPEAQKTDLDYVNDLRDFINEETELTQRTYRQIVVVVDPSASSFKLQARRFHMKSKNAVNDVLTGIRTVSTYMGQNKLFICDSCENLIRELQTYVWDEKAQLRGVDLPRKVEDHACITGDTLINTTEGYIPIEDLVGKTGYVNTLNPKTGEKCVCKFSNVVLTKNNADVVEIEFVNGDKVKITKDHPVLTPFGWKTVENLSYNDEILNI